MPIKKSSQTKIGGPRLLTLNKFKPRKLERLRNDPKQGESTVLFVGSKRAGKTTMILEIMRYLRRIPQGIIVTGSLSSAEQFKQHFPDSFIFTEINDQLIHILETIIAEQEEKRKTKKDFHGFFILFDDCGYDSKLSKQEVLRKMFMNGRHYKLQVLYSIQDTKSVPPGIRKNSDFIFIHRENGVMERKKLHQEFGSVVPDMKTFNKIMDAFTADYKCIVVDRTIVKSNNISDNIFWYKAKWPPVTDWKLGSKEFWQTHYTGVQERKKNEKKEREKDKTKR